MFECDRRVVRGASSVSSEVRALVCRLFASSIFLMNPESKNGFPRSVVGRNHHHHHHNCIYHMSNSYKRMEAVRGKKIQ